MPSKTLLRPGEALQAAREAPGAREAVSGGARPEGAFEWRDFMVSGYDDGAKAAYLEVEGHRGAPRRGATRGPGQRRGRAGRLLGRPHGDRHRLGPGGAADPTACASSTASGPTARRPALTEVPSRLLVLGGGPVGVEMAQAVRAWAPRSRWSRAWTTCSRASRSRSATHSASALAAEGIELYFGQHASAVRREAASTCSSSPSATSCAATGCSSRPAGGRAPRGSGSRPSASSPTRAGHPGRRRG